MDPLLSAILVTLIIFALATMWRPPIAIAAICCIYGFEQWAQAQSGFFGQYSAFLNYTSAALVGIGLASAYARGKNPLQNIPAITWVFTVLFGYAALSTLWSVNSDITWTVYINSIPYHIVFVGFTPLLLIEERDTRTAFVATLFAGGVVCLLLFLGTQVGFREIQFDTLVVDARTGGYHQAGSPLSIATLGGTTVLIAVLMNFSGIGHIWSVLRWGVVLLGLAVTIQSGSRGQLLAALLLLTILIGISKGGIHVRTMVFGSTALIVTGYAAVSFITYFGFADRFDVTTFGEAYGDTRGELVSGVFEYWSAADPIAWFFGLGSSASWHLINMYPHVIPIEILFELGLFGFVVYLVAIILTTRSLIRLYRYMRMNMIERGVFTTMVAMVMFQFLLTLKQGSLMRETYFFMFAVMVCRYELIVSALLPARLAKIQSYHSWQQWLWYQQTTANSTADLR